MCKHASILLVTLVLIPLLGTDALAVTRTSSQSGNWSASTTWGGNPAPVAGDDVIINGGFTVTVDLSNAACLSIQLGGSVLNAGSGTLAFNSGTQLTVSGVLNVGPFNNNTTPGSLTMASGGTLICQGITVGRLGTWTAGTGSIELTATNTIPNDNNVNFNNLTISGGTTTLPRNVSVNGNLVINLGATLNGGANILTVGGDWTNNGTFTGNTGTVTFVKNGNATISGTGINNFNLIRVNLGTSISNTLEVTASNFSAPDPFLTITNGTFKMSGSFTFSNTFIVGPIYNIDPGTGFWINNPNVTVIGQAAGGVSVRGMLRLSAGTYNVGTGVDNSLNYVTGSTIIIEGGALHIAGQLTRNNATATISYTQSGGTVTVVEQGSTNATFGGFDLGAVGSTFTMSGGTIVIRNATSGPAEYVNASSVASVTGGTLQIGDASTANAQTIRIQSARPIGNLLVSNATSQATKPTAQLTSSATVVGNVTVQPGTTLNANGLNISLGGDWTNSGTFTSGGNTVTFNGTAAQVLTGVGVETFNNLIVNKPAGTLTLNSDATVSNAFSLAAGTIAVGTGTLTLHGPVTGGGTLTSAATGTVDYAQSSVGQSILAGNYGNLVFSDFNKTLASAGTIGIGGTFTPGAASGHTVTGSTIAFDGGSQTIPAFSYNNLTISGSGTKTGSGTLTVGGNLTNNAGSIFSGTTTLNLNGTTHANGGTLSVATLSVGSGATLTNNGIITTSTALSGAGTLTQGTTGIVNIGGTAGITTLNASAAGNTVNYTGASQTVAPTTYHHLTLSGSGTPILIGVSTINGNFTLSGTVIPSAATGMTVGGNFAIGSGTSFDAGSFSHTLQGNWSNAGTFNAGTSTFTLNGTSAQTMSGSTFSNLTINNAAGVSMLSDETVSNTLTLTNGAFSIGAHTLNLNGALSLGGGSLVGGTSSNIVVGGSGASTTLPAVTLNNLTLNRASGDSLAGDATINGALTITNGTLNTGVNAVILGPTGTLSEPPGQPVFGTVRTTRNITATTGTETFGNIGSDIALNGVALGSTTVLRKTGTASSGSGHSSIKRYFDITPTTNTGLNAGLVFHYDATEVNGQNPNTFELYRSRDNGSTWNNLGGTVNTTLRTISATGLNGFSRWTASDTSNRVGNTATPTTTSINPASKNAGDPAFTLTVNGAEFINGKSTVRFNGADRTTTYVSSSQLTAAIPASDLLVVGTFPVTVFNVGGGGLSNAQTLTVNPGAPTRVRVETAADGSGTVVPAQSLASGSSITVYAITRDALNNFVANVAATAWTLENIIGGVVAGDLVPAVDARSAVFTAHVIGTADIKATSGVLATTPSGMISVTPGPLTTFAVEAAGGGPIGEQQQGTSFNIRVTAKDASNNTVTSFSETVDITSSGTLSSGGGTTPPLIGGVLTSRGVTVASTGSTTITATRTTGGVQSGTSNAFNVVVSFTQTMNAGWNMIALPTNPLNAYYLSLYPTANPGTLYTFSGSYLLRDTMRIGTGYWLNFPSAVLAPTNGLPVSVATVILASGWNMIGGVSCAVPLARVTDPGGIIVPGTLYGFNGSYVPSDTIRQGKGYWILARAAGAIGVACGVGPAKVMARYDVTAFPSLHISDAAGSGRTLYLNVALKDSTAKRSFSLPPLPPAGGFDARFAGESSICESADGIISIQASRYPLTITPANLPASVDTQYILTEVTTNTAGSQYILRNGAAVVISKAEVKVLKIGKVGTRPTVFALGQNYPNPFNPSTTITYQLPVQSQVLLKVFDIVGREVATLIDAVEEAGYKSVRFNASGLASGVYFYRLNGGKFTSVKKFVLLR